MGSSSTKFNFSAIVEPCGYHRIHICEIIGEGALGHITCASSGTLPSQHTAERSLHWVATQDEQLYVWSLRGIGPYATAAKV